MSHFFVSPEQIQNGMAVITGGDVNHIRNVLRKKPGDPISVSDGVSPTYLCAIEEVSDGQIVARILSQAEGSTELSQRVVLFQGLPKGDKMELIVQKAVELGVSEIVPVAMHNCVMKLAPQKAEARIRRWQAIAESAAKQSGRNRLPAVSMPLSFREALTYGSALEMRLLPYENSRGMDRTRELIRRCRDLGSVGLFIGPEGGYTPEEVDLAKQAGWEPVSLGCRILRTETAGLAALAMLVYELDV